MFAFEIKMSHTVKITVGTSWLESVSSVFALKMASPNTYLCSRSCIAWTSSKVVIKKCNYMQAKFCSMSMVRLEIKGRNDINSEMGTNSAQS